MHILLTRPEPAARRMAVALEAAGHRVTIEPLLAIEPRALPGDALDGVDALLLTSRNAVRALEGLIAGSSVRDVPVYAVGPGTASAARTAGFDHVVTAGGDAEALANEVIGDLCHAPDRTRRLLLLHPSGEELAKDFSPLLREKGFDYRRVIAYRAVAKRELTCDLQRLLGDGLIDAVVLMSPRTASIWSALVIEAGLRAAVAAMVHICMSAAVAARLEPLANPVIAVARAPTAASITELIADLEAA